MIFLYIFNQQPSLSFAPLSLVSIVKVASLYSDLNKLNLNVKLEDSFRKVFIAPHSQITLKSKFNQQFFGYRHQTQSFAACFPPPSSVIADLKGLGKVDIALKFEIVPHTG